MTIINILKTIGLEKPSMATRPVLFFNNKELAKEEYYYKTPQHQDYISMRGSLDSVVVWIPLVKTTEANGALEIIPGSHKNGALPYTKIGGFASVNGYQDEDFKKVEMEIGDMLVFSTFLVHRSGEITDNSTRWSCSFRYNNMSESDFANRNFEFGYIYKPTFS